MLVRVCGPEMLLLSKVVLVEARIRLLRLLCHMLMIVRRIWAVTLIIMMTMLLSSLVCVSNSTNTLNY